MEKHRKNKDLSISIQNFNDLDETIRKLEYIRDLLREIRDLRDDVDIPFTAPVTPLPFYPPQPFQPIVPDSVKPWVKPPEIWC